MKTSASINNLPYFFFIFYLYKVLRRFFIILDKGFMSNKIPFSEFAKCLYSDIHVSDLKPERCTDTKQIELIRQITETIETISEHISDELDKLIFQMHYADGLSIEEINEALSIGMPQPYTNAYARLSFARRKVEPHLHKYMPSSYLAVI